MFKVRSLAFVAVIAAASSAPAFAGQVPSFASFGSANTHATVNGGASRLSLPLAHPDKTKYPICGTQFTYTLSPNQTALFFTFDWPQGNYVDWTVMDNTVNTSGEAAVSLTNVGTQYTGSGEATYWLTVQNLTSSNQAIEGRYCYLG